MAQSFMEALSSRQAEGKFVCVGLDSQCSKLPAHLLEDNRGHNPQWVFNRHIVDATAAVAGAFKINRAFYSGVSGIEAIERTVRYIHAAYPGIPVIGDGKWNDIGNTNDGYVEELFELIEFDAVTINPYLGMEAMKPFLEMGDKGIFVLARTSNPGAAEFQDTPVRISHDEAEELGLCGHPDDGEGMTWATTCPLYLQVAFQVSHNWNGHGNCGVVAGATHPYELEQIRKMVGDIPLLIPGIGAQGGDLEATVKAATSRPGAMLINSSRGIILAYKNTLELGERNYAAAAAKATKDLHDQITAALAARKGEV